MAVSFEGFPRVVDRHALRPGRWFLAGDGARPLICFSTEDGEDDERLILTFSSGKPETLDFVPALLKTLTGPLATLEHDLVFAPGLPAQGPPLAAPMRRAFRSGALLRLRSGDLGIGFAAQAGGAAPAGALMIISLATGHRAEGFDLVFDRWSLFLRRGASERLVGAFRPI